MNIRAAKNAGVRYAAAFKQCTFVGFAKPRKFKFNSFYWAHYRSAREYIKARAG